MPVGIESMKDDRDHLLEFVYIVEELIASYPERRIPRIETDLEYLRNCAAQKVEVIRARFDLEG